MYFQTKNTLKINHYHIFEHLLTNPTFQYSDIYQVTKPINLSYILAICQILKITQPLSIFIIDSSIQLPTKSEYA